MLEKLTQEQEELKSKVSEFWINKAFNQCHEGIDKEKFETGISWLYNTLLKLDTPQVIYCDSILEAGIKITLVKDYNKDINIYDPSMMELKGEMFTKDFKNKLRDNLGLNSSYVGWANFGWVAFYDYFTKIGVLDHELFNNYIKLIDSNVFECFEFENVVFAVQPPKKIHYNQNNLPSNTMGSAIIFNDGSEYHMINGVKISKELFDKLYNETYTFNDFVNEPNEEIKSTILAYKQERYGEFGVFDFLRSQLKEIDTYTDIKDEKYLEGTTGGQMIGTYTLFKGKYDKDTEIAYVRCYCPSTDRMFFLGVEPSNTNAKDSIASLYRIPNKLCNEIKSIQRQGERFSTTFTDKGREMMKTMTKEEASDLVSLSGDKYFELMRYEY